MHFTTLLDYRLHADFRYIPGEEYTPKNTVVSVAANLRQRGIKHWSWERHHTLLTFQMGDD
jgi:hypothetical protein